MSDACADRLDALLTATDGLIALIEASADSSEPDRKADESLAVVERYRAKLAEGMRDRADQIALAAANLLTTVNAGFADAVWADDKPEIAAAAMAVTRSALAAARCLRDRLGMGF